ncbi:MAG: hypothetical protein MCS20_01300, partial [Candidatus Phytoplasma mali]|nr:hypothetical protein [Candidatus Phytoplasma mali]MCZ8632171.1 hypothetical protein [Spiroplasma sp. Tabriz.8]
MIIKDISFEGYYFCYFLKKKKIYIYIYIYIYIKKETHSCRQITSLENLPYKVRLFTLLFQLFVYASKKQTAC